jgi:6,7-dimethyl-8-ribityllumazine synthase
LKTRLALVKIASHLCDAGRDDQEAPSIWSTWLRGALAEMLNAQRKITSLGLDAVVILGVVSSGEVRCC